MLDYQRVYLVSSETTNRGWIDIIYNTKVDSESHLAGQHLDLTTDKCIHLGDVLCIDVYIYILYLAYLYTYNIF